jgi:glyoxylase-like metal-dependent hydrolase (beta-lactamase superfamily II)
MSRIAPVADIHRISGRSAIPVMLSPTVCADDDEQAGAVIVASSRTPTERTVVFLMSPMIRVTLPFCRNRPAAVRGSPEIKREGEAALSKIVTLDLRYRGSSETIASFLAGDGEGGFVLFESGPGSCRRQLAREVVRSGYTMSQLRAVFLTHIHLDHAGAAGTLARQTGCEVFVHPVGERHLLDPGAKLMPSARRLYGWKLPFIWGRMEAVPRGQVTSASDGQTFRVGSLEVIGWHTPGHASHHVAWQIGDSVVTGDVGGVRFPGTRYVAPPMPPPDIDVEQWRASVRLLRDLDPRQLLLTHYGPVADVGHHLEQLDGRMVRWSEIAREEVDAGTDVETVERRLTAFDDREVAEAGVQRALVERGRRICPIGDSAAGLFRYWSTRPSAAG